MAGLDRSMSSRDSSILPQNADTRRSFLRWAVLLVACLLTTSSISTAQATPQQDPATLDLQAAAAQAVQTYCFDCHTGDDPEGGIEVEFLTLADASFEKNVETVEKVLRVLKERQMPPTDGEQPSDQERLQILEWVQQQLNEFDCGSASRPGRVTVRRLNRVEYDNTIQDLTGLDLRLAKDFPSDDVGNGFDNIGDVLTLPPILMEKYLAAAAEVAIAVAEDEQARKRVFPHEFSDPNNLEEVVQAARDNAASFGLRAFRRPLSAAELERVFELMRSTWQAGATQEEIMQTVITALLSSPSFIFRIEDDSKADFVDGIRPLNDFEIASRLSYFLWSSMPDERLFELASQSKLHTPEQIRQEVDRMLGDKKSIALVKNFAGQWLQLRDLDLLSPDPDEFGTFDDELRQAMRGETEALFQNLIDHNRPITDLLNADYTFVNERLARHYGLDGIQGDEFRRVDLNGTRSGVLMHASILLLTSNPTRTSPVKRGKWVLDNLLGEPPPPPPPDVPELDESAETLGSLRQQMEQHRANPNCAVCHTKMDALGFGLENFDAVGKWRDLDGRDRIDPSGELPGGRKFSGPVELVQILAEDKKREFARCMSEKLLTYALGRGLGTHDRCTVNTIVDELAGSEFAFGTMVKAVVTSPPFLYQEEGR